jgi:hypothetical protein
MLLAIDWLAMKAPRYAFYFYFAGFRVSGGREANAS